MVSLMSNELIEKSVEYLTKTRKLYESSHMSEIDQLVKTNPSKALEHPDITGQHISKILSKSNDFFMKDKALSHPKAPTHEITKKLDSLDKHGISYHEMGLASTLMRHPNAPKDHPVFTKIKEYEAKRNTQKPTPAPTEIKLGSKWGGKDIPTSRFD